MLCQANNNTCNNLAEIKGRKRNGETKYGRFCDGHRRKGHTAATIKKSDRRYIPLDGCVMCITNQATARHRILQGGEYTKTNIIGLCGDCHRKIHRLYNKLNDMSFQITPKF